MIYTLFWKGKLFAEFCHENYFLEETYFTFYLYNTLLRYLSFAQPKLSRLQIANKMLVQSFQINREIGKTGKKVF